MIDDAATDDACASDDPNRSESFRVRLRRLREARNVTPNTLASLVGVTEGAIRQMESGQTHAASLRVGVRLAEALGVTPAYLAFGDGDGRDDPKVLGKPYVISVDTRDRWDEMERRFTRMRERLVRVENRIRHLPQAEPR
ncbi:MAG: helix-turn-helix domain-containing protein [Candidatus Eremiobacteraeota bacterium]|nr:helix-turn-helix domain-containing protein [Candidatus Eremiobacteraeota bacterium]